MSKKINIAWVCRDGYKDLFPLIDKDLSKKISINSSYITHLKKDVTYLKEKYDLENITVLSDVINGISTKGLSLSNFSLNYTEAPMIRMLWSTMFELKLNQEDIYSLTLSHIIFWEDYLATNAIDILIYERPSILSSCIAWLVCQKNNIRCIDFVDTAIDSMTIVDNLNGDYADKLLARFEHLLSNEFNDHKFYNHSVAYLNRLNTNPEKTKESLLCAEITDELAKFNFKKFYKFSNLINNHLKEKKYFIYKRSFYKKLITHVLYIFRANFHKYINIYSDINSEKKEDYFLYPLFMQGEWSNHIFMNPDYHDPISAIKKISICLPPGKLLYVKEHYSGYADRRISDLLKIKRISNVRLVSHKEDPFSLVNNSKAVVTAGSTMGFEAMIMSKPVILLGDPWYRLLPGINHVSRIEDIAALMASVDDLKEVPYSKKLYVLQALYDISAPGLKVPRKGSLDTNNIRNMTSILLEYIENI